MVVYFCNVVWWWYIFNSLGSFRVQFSTVINLNILSASWRTRISQNLAWSRIRQSSETIFYLDMIFVLFVLFLLINRMSSRYAIANSIPANMVSITCWNNLGATFNSKGRRISLKIPLCVLIAHNWEHSSFTFPCWYGSDRSVLENSLLQFSLEKISFGEGNEYVWSFNPIRKICPYSNLLVSFSLHTL